MPTEIQSGFLFPGSDNTVGSDDFVVLDKKRPHIVVPSDGEY
jgi:hypothetical protein